MKNKNVVKTQNVMTLLENPLTIEVATINSKTREVLSIRNFPLRKVSSFELWNIRHNLDEAGIVFKLNGQLWYSKIPRDLNFLSAPTIGGTHLCGNCSRFLKCKKVFDLQLNSAKDYAKDFESALADSNRIEKYPFVKNGYESFNVDSSKLALVITSCDNYKKSAERKSKISYSQKMEILSSLDEFFSERELSSKTSIARGKTRSNLNNF